MVDLLKSATVIDLSHLINQSISVYPGTAPPVLEYTSTIAGDGFTEMKLILNSHSATHIDAPAHMIAGGKTLDHFPPDQFIGRGFVVDCRSVEGREIPATLLHHLADDLAKADFILFCTGWSKKWGTAAYLEDYPVLSPEAMEWIIQFPIKGVGFDTISPDPIDSAQYPAHLSILGRELLIIENLANIDLLAGRAFHLFCLPIRTENADAAPARVLALLQG